MQEMSTSKYQFDWSKRFTLSRLVNEVYRPSVLKMLEALPEKKQAQWKRDLLMKNRRYVERQLAEFRKHPPTKRQTEMFTLYPFKLGDTSVVAVTELHAKSLAKDGSQFVGYAIVVIDQTESALRYSHLYNSGLN